MTWGCPNCERDNVDARSTCVHCNEARPAPAASDRKGCERCGANVPLNTFHDDTPEIKDRGARLCASCWIPALKRRCAGVTRDTRCPEPGCTKTVAEHIAEAKAITSSQAWEERFGGEAPRESQNGRAGVVAL